MATDKDAVVCDLAEIYHVYDWQALPVSYAATLVCGLQENSRTRKALTGVNFDTTTILLAAAVDHLALLVWANSQDGRKNRNRPKRLVDVLTNKAQVQGHLSFASGSEFESARKAILKGVV